MTEKDERPKIRKRKKTQDFITEPFTDQGGVEALYPKFGRPVSCPCPGHDNHWAPCICNCANCN